MAATYSPRDNTQVPSAMRGLTSLFGKGRGEDPRNNHHKIFVFAANILLYQHISNHTHLNKVILEKLTYEQLSLPSLTAIIDLKNKAYGQLVLLDFDVTTFTSIAYQRHRL